MLTQGAAMSQASENAPRDLRETSNVRLGVGVAERGSDSPDRCVTGVLSKLLDRDGIREDGIVVEGLVGVDGISEDYLVDAGVAETTRTDEHAFGIGRFLEPPGIDDFFALRNTEGNSVVAPGRVDNRGAHSFGHTIKLVIELGGQLGGVAVDVAQIQHELESSPDRHDLGEVDGPVFETSVSEGLRGVEVLHDTDK